MRLDRPAAATKLVRHLSPVGALLVAVLAGVMLLAVPATARAFQVATVSGRVLDPYGVPVPDVTVRINDPESGAQRLAETDQQGQFRVVGLRPGDYELVVEDPRYARYRRTEVTLEPGDNVPLRIVLQPAEPDFIAAPDRWGLDFPQWLRYPDDKEGSYPFVEGRLLDPYNQNVLKGDRPIIGQDIFMVLTGISQTPFELRRVPTPSGVSNQEPDSEQFFGEPDQLAVLQNALLSFELFKGDTAFKPKDWAVRITPALNVNYTNTGERNVVNISPEAGKNRFEEDFALQEAFGEVKLFDVGEHYDFVSVRAGIQPFVSDFRGFLFRDDNLGVRLFGNWGRNQNQWNLAFFEQLEKETNSALNLLERRNQHVIVANYYRQDFLTLGYTISPSFHANLDEGDEFFFDANGFLVRPAAVGVVRPHAVRAYYVGFAGDGHIGRLNLTHQFYQAFGTDELNGIAGQETDINAQFAAVELSIDKDWYRPRATFVYASGDDEPGDDEATGFDAIFDAPNIVGGPFSFWNRQGIRLSQTQVELVGRDSILPALRSSKLEGQANFVNPGLLLVNLGWDAELTPKLRTALNVSYMRFASTEVLRRLLFQGEVDEEIGLDYSIGFEYRPWLNDNVVLLGGVAGFTPGSGFRDLLVDQTLYSPFLVATFKY